jgi:hypothetical protein
MQLAVTSVAKILWSPFVSARITTTYTMGVGSPVTVALVVTTGNVVSVKRQ